MSVAAKALWIIERNAHQPLSLASIAEACGVSRSHLANAFGAATGLSVIKYLRARRLSQAAAVLADGAPDILSVALDTGYGSHEAFTRAFREHFSETPERVRSRGGLDGLPITPPLSLARAERPALAAPEFRREGPVRVVGLGATYTWESTNGISSQWPRFMAFYDAISEKTAAIPLGVTEPPDEDGHFTHLCAVEVARFVDVPVGLRALEMPPRRYAVFEHPGHVSALPDSYAAIWNEALPAHGCVVADAPSLERHNPTFDTRSGEGGLTLWIPLAD